MRSRGRHALGRGVALREHGARMSVLGLTLDTGALVALERRDLRARRLVESAIEHGATLTVPSPVLVEWWRGSRMRRSVRILEDMVLEPLDAHLAFVAGEALAIVGSGPSPTDAVVMASAAQRADVVLTSDVGDLERLREVFPQVRVIRV